MKKLFFHVMIMLISMINFNLSAQEFNFHSEEHNQTADWLEIQGMVSTQSANPNGPINLEITKHGEVGLLTGMPPFSSCTWPFCYKSIQDYLKVGVVKDYPEHIDAYKIVLEFEVKIHSSSSTSIAPNIPGGPPAQGSFTVTSFPKFATIDYNPAAGTLYTDIDVVKYPGGHIMEVKLLNAKKYNLANPSAQPQQIALSALPKNIVIKTVVATQRIDLINNAVPLIVPAYANGLLDLSFKFDCSGSYYATPRSVDYELEWYYIDDYHVTPVSGTPTVSRTFYGSSASIAYNFKNNANRVRLSTPQFSIPMIYQSGAIIYRVRALRPNINNYSEVLYSDWSLPESGSIALNNTASVFVIGTNRFAENFSWNYSINFAEQGKYKNAISFYDGALNKRQSQTKINSDANYSIVVDNILDYEGRPSIVSLPIPIQHSTATRFAYEPHLLRKTNGYSLRPIDFDDRGTAAGACVVPSQAMSALISNTTQNYANGELYYSINNPDQTGRQKFVPQSGGYPYVQTVLSPTNEVLASGGAGPSLQIAPNGHFTTSFYGAPLQKEIDKVLGSEAGFDEYYTKALTTDPNGQASYTVLNKAGKPVITALAGLKPSVHSEIPGYATALNAPTLKDNLISPVQSRADGIVKAQSSFMIDADASPVSLKYTASIKPFFPCNISPAGGTPYPYIQLKAQLGIKVSNSCGETVLDQASANFSNNSYNATIGNNTVVNNNTPYTFASANSIVTPTLGKGAYTYVKELAVTKDNMKTAATDFISTHFNQHGVNFNCTYTSKESFVADEVQKITAPCDNGAPGENMCDALARKFRKELQPGEKYGQYSATELDGELAFSATQPANSVFTGLPYTGSGLVVPSSIAANTQDGLYAVNGGVSYTTPPLTGIFTKWEFRYFNTSTPAYCQYAAMNSNTTGISGSGSSAGLRTIRYSTKIWIGDDKWLKPQGIGRVDLYISGKEIQTVPNRIWIDNDLVAWRTSEGGTHNMISSNVNQGFTTNPGLPKFWIVKLGSLAHLGWNTIEVEMKFLPFLPIVDYSQFLPSAFFFVPQCFGCNVMTSKYRYQMECIQYPTISYNGMVYGNSDMINGVSAIDIHNMNLKDFVELYNAHLDAISEALLPLHPEYCMLQSCVEDKAFARRLERSATFQQAQAEGFLNLSDTYPAGSVTSNYTDGNVNTLIENDPLYDGNNARYPELTHLAGVKIADLSTYSVNDIRRKTIDQIALEMAYCAAGNSVEQMDCKTNFYSSQIASKTFLNDDVKQKYWENLKRLYIASRDALKTRMLSMAANTCTPCPDVRMTLIGQPTLPFETDDDITLEVNSSVFTDPDLPMNDLYGISSAATFNNAINNPLGNSTVVNAGTQNAIDDLVDNFLAPLLNELNNLGLSGDMKTFVKDKVTSDPTQKLTPVDVNDWLNSNGVVLNTTVNAFVLDYNILNPHNEEADPYFCSPDTRYADLTQFVNNKLLTPNSYSYTISIANSSNSVESDIYEYLAGTNMPGSITVNVVKQNWSNTVGAQNSPFWQYTLSYNSNNIDLYITPLKNESQGIALPSSMVSASCINGEAVLNIGIMAKYTSILNSTSHRYLFWNKLIPMMTETAEPEFERAVNCWDIRKGVQDYMNGHGTYHYATYYDDPLFSTALTNYLNYTFNKRYDWDKYEMLMEGCALSDHIMFTESPYVQSYRFVNANSFINYLTAQESTTNGSELRMGLDMVKLKYNNGTHDYVLLDYGRIPKHKVQLVSQLVNQAATVASAVGLFLTAPASNTCAELFIPIGSTAPTLNSSYFNTLSSPTTVSIVEDGVTNQYSKYQLTFVSALVPPATSALKLQSDALAYVKQYIYSTYPKAKLLFYKQLVRSADYSLKQNYLNYAYSSSITTREQAVTALSPSNASLQSLFPTGPITYTNPLCTGILNNFSVSPSSSASISSDLTTALSGYGALPAASTATAATTGSYRRMIRKDNGVYWFIYIKYAPVNSADHGYKLYNAYVIPPAGIDLTGYTLSTSSITGGQSNNNGDVLFFNITATKTGGSPATVACKGYTDFPVTTGGLLLKNVVLLESPGASCINTYDCEYLNLQNSIKTGEAIHAEYFEEQTELMVNRMIAHLADPANVTETLDLEQKALQYQFTTYAYDRAGNLIKTTPPEGINELTTTTALNTVETNRSHASTITQANLAISHNKQTKYAYNSLNQVFEEQTPDAGYKKFFYDSRGRLSFTQSAQQASEGRIYSYILYDEQGRTIESGEVALKIGTINNNVTPNIIQKCLSHTEGSTEILETVRTNSWWRKDAVVTEYDEPSLLPAEFTASYRLVPQDNLRARVASVKYFSTLASVPLSNTLWDDNPDYGLHYSYDELGNVKTLTHEIQRLKDLKQKYKTIDYEYDLQSGKVNMVSYNKGFPDQFYHRYEYDADNRITLVETSPDGIVWTADAAYEYYKHGPLSKVLLGDDNLQNIEYAYTLQGWLKAINGDVLNPNGDMGRSGIPNTTTPDVNVQDAYAHALDYFNGDYSPIGTTAVNSLPTNSIPTNNQLYNGNIARQYTSIAGFTGTNGEKGLERNYKYDQLNRLTQATNNYYDNQNFTVASNLADLYKSTYAYDKDGNIKELDRWSANAKIDDLTYSYLKTSGYDNRRHNQLHNVTEGITSSAPNYDIKPASGFTGYTYQYDLDGNLVKDQRDKMDVSWNNFNKVNRILYTEPTTQQQHILSFRYDGMGNRVAKEDSKLLNNSFEERTGDYYIRDAAGNVLTVYKLKSTYTNLFFVAEANNAGISLHGSTAVHNFVKGKITASPGLSASLQQNVLEQLPVWAESTATAKPPMYFIDNNADIKRTLLTSVTTYLDALHAFEGEANLTGHEALATAIQSKSETRSELIYHTLQDGTTTAANLEHFVAHLPVSAVNQLWAAFSLSYNSESPAASIEALATAMSENERKNEIVDVMNEVNDRTTERQWDDYVQALVADERIFMSDVLRDGDRSDFETFLMNTTANMVNGEFTTDFLHNWDPAATWVTDHIETLTKLNVILETEPGVYLDAIWEQAESVINATLANGPSFLPTGYLGEMEAANIPVSQLTGSLSLVADQVALAEHHIYGSDHLGIQYHGDTWMKNAISAGNPVGATPPLNLLRPWYHYGYGDLVSSLYNTAWVDWDHSYFSTTRVVGTRQYSLKDHLGNVVLTLRDRRVGNLPSGNTIYNYWKADIASAQDYYPFGMLMPDRITLASGSTFRFGFNGMERDDELKKGMGNSINYEARIYDIRLGRFLSVDPLTMHFPWYTPYQFAGNTPIQAIDLDGAEPLWFQKWWEEIGNRMPMKPRTARDIEEMGWEEQKMASRREAYKRFEKDVEKMAETYESIYGIVPGYSFGMQMIRGNYKTAAAYGALDLFGGHLVFEVFGLGKAVVARTLGRLELSGAGRRIVEVLEKGVASYKESFKAGKYEMQEATEDFVVYRVSGGTSSAEYGEFFSILKPKNAAEAEEMLNIVKWGNPGEAVTPVTIRKGQQYAIGQVEGGTGTQIFIHRYEQGTLIRHLDATETLLIK